MMLGEQPILVTGLPLLPARFRAPGYFLVALGLLLGAARFHYGVKPALFEVRLFAVFSSFFQTQFFTTFTKNAAGEVAALLVLVGLSATAFSREKREDGSLDPLRLRALLLAMEINGLLLALSLFLVFGFGFVYVLAANLFSTQLLYLAIFRWLLRRHVREATLGAHPSINR